MHSKQIWPTNSFLAENSGGTTAFSLIWSYLRVWIKKLFVKMSQMPNEFLQTLSGGGFLLELSWKMNRSCGMHGWKIIRQQGFGRIIRSEIVDNLCFFLTIKLKSHIQSHLRIDMWYPGEVSGAGEFSGEGPYVPAGNIVWIWCGVWCLH